jgi:DNA-binding NtrC family response regulator
MNSTIRAMGHGEPIASKLCVANLLVVDDDLDVCWILRELLEGAGHTVRVAHDGQEGLKRLEESMPDAVVLDVEMPILDGPGLAYRMFVHNVGLENIPIVLVSGVYDLQSIARQVGTPYFMGKPFDFGVLLSTLGRSLDERALPRPPD